MEIQLFDMDFPYTLKTECNAEGVNFVRIKPNTSKQYREDDYDICLTIEQCDELARCLMFMSKEL